MTPVPFQSPLPNPRILAQGISRLPNPQELNPHPQTRADICHGVLIPFSTQLTFHHLPQTPLLQGDVFSVPLDWTPSETPAPTDVDECSSGAPCGLHGHCTNTEGSFRCSCAPGYRVPSGLPGPCAGGQGGDNRRAWELVLGYAHWGHRSCSKELGSWACRVHPCNSIHLGG